MKSNKLGRDKKMWKNKQKLSGGVRRRMGSREIEKEEDSSREDEGGRMSPKKVIYI